MHTYSHNIKAPSPPDTTKKRNAYLMAIAKNTAASAWPLAALRCTYAAQQNTKEGRRGLETQQPNQAGRTKTYIIQAFRCVRSPSHTPCTLQQQTALQGDAAAGPRNERMG